MASFRHLRTVGTPVRTAGLVGVVMAACLAFSATAAPVPLQSPQIVSPAPPARFTIYFRTVPIGDETVSVERTAEGWTITSSGRADAPIDLIAREVRVRYTADWKPIDLALDITLRGQALNAVTTVSGTSALSKVSQAGQSNERTDAIAPDTIFLPSPMWGPFEALAQRLQTASAGTTIQAYTPGVSFPIQVTTTGDETLLMGTRSIHAKRVGVSMMAPGTPPVVAEIWVDDAGRLMRVNIPSQAMEIVRSDIASVAVRRVVIARPGDKETRIPANGFNIAATISAPSDNARDVKDGKGGGKNTKAPAVVLVGGTGLTDRDEVVSGIPVFGQLSGALADAGFLVLRYDRRGIGQSGGREEAATLGDFADDLLAVVAGVRRMSNVDGKHVAIVGYGDGGLVAMQAASRSKSIAALALLSMFATTGAEYNLWQVKHGLERSTRPETERQAIVDLQQRIQTAVLTGSGWDTIPSAYRRQADVPWFKTFLEFDPAKVLAKMSQPLLIVQGSLDTEVPESSADRLEELARQRKGAAVDVARVPGVNHLLVPARTGETDEYVSLQDARVSPAVSDAIAAWVRRVVAAR